MKFRAPKLIGKILNDAPERKCKSTNVSSWSTKKNNEIIAGNINIAEKFNNSFANIVTNDQYRVSVAQDSIFNLAIFCNII